MIVSQIMKATLNVDFKGWLIRRDARCAPCSNKWLFMGMRKDWILGSTKKLWHTEENKQSKKCQMEKEDHRSNPAPDLVNFKFKLGKKAKLGSGLYQ